MLGSYPGGATGGSSLEHEMVKEGLDKMAIAFGMTQNALINLAVATMVVKYEAEGTRIFFDLISLPTKTK